ncbi:acyl-CoA dehydrogenase [Pseudomaricurvus alkylphenolicus]|jgi:alkylation response protein AidB-like acyl-CoA dehydrogenase|uniref:acyl-CoA dehydrogenase family protein n=1 Tax=Pseudomaricurvus alkylphenolicus TaxID=1306991 RepID=UPI00141DFFA1|nr:acyl-CoA dehydrogenase family protein [Pseudomaricurvus alkylphenolicus]NIB41028.1 acyl-CoA dehydrogenase [Pseudomaricurvus alkylphenolicus]
MALVLSEEQRFLQDTAREFFQQQSPVSALRQLRDTRDAKGYDGDVWQQIVELGWNGMIFPEELGGLDFGFMGLGAVLEQAGHTLNSSPLLDSVVLAGSVVLLAGNDQQRRELIPALIEGRLRIALALDEDSHHNPATTALRASPRDNNYELNGQKRYVANGGNAEHLIVVARTSGEPGDQAGLSLFLVSANDIQKQASTRIDSRNCANLTFDQVTVSENALLGSAGGAFPVLDQALDRARICVSAEMLGSAQELLDRTVAYLKERNQFGVPIGSFQALQHRAAIMFAELELARSTVMAALEALDSKEATTEEVATLASLAKAKVGEVCQLISNEAIQLHGGIGVTDELEIGFFLKRLRVAEQSFGNTGFHRSRFATLNGY